MFILFAPGATRTFACDACSRRQHGANYQHKDVILVLLTNGEPQRDGLHVIRLDGGLFVKRLQCDFNGVRVISDNPIYASRGLSKAELAELNIVGRVVWAGKKF